MSDQIHEQLKSLVESHPVVLFMKGDRQAPQCGFSARVVEILDEYLPEYATVNVLADPAVRSGIKEFSSWPTIPQLYVNAKFVGGCDIVTEMSQNGELDDVLGMKRAEVPVPEVFVSDAALEKLTHFYDGEGAPTVRLEIGPQWQYGLDFSEPRPKDVVVEGTAWRFVMSRAAARKADGLKIDFVESAEGGGFKIDNPNEPARVNQLMPEELKAWMDGNKPVEVFDVRTPEERATASIVGTTLLDEAGAKRLEALERDVTLVFHCHHGGRSQRAAQQALQLGFTDVHNLAGGIDGWSQRVDDTVPRY